MNPNKRHKVIYDTDPGVDDAMALYFALAHPDIEVVGITTTFGNVSVEQAATNALYLMDLAGYSAPVTKGVATPWVKKPEAPPAHIHGADGLGNLGTRRPVKAQLDPRSSAQFIVDTARAHPGEISLVAVGPLGNLSLALAIEPRLPQLLREVVIMGGTVLEPGNVSPVAEANIWNDPHAADRVFTAGWKLTMVGLDVTHRVVVLLDMFEKFAQKHQHPATDVLRDGVKFYSRFYSDLYKNLAASPGCFAHDLLAFVYLVRPDLFTVDTKSVRVSTDDLAQGQTIVNRRDFIDYAQAGWEPERPRTQVCMAVNAQACIQLFEETMMSDWLARA